MKKRQSKSLFRSGRVSRTKRICQNAVNIEALEERRLLTVFSVGTNADSGAGSLRQAILDANSTPGADTVNFQIGSGAATITLDTPLPAISEQLTIDGCTQPGYAGSPLIWIAGSAGSASSPGLELQSNSSEIDALTITGFHDGIVLAGTGGHSVLRSFIGITPDGAGSGNTFYGIDVQSDHNMIGGTAAGKGNVISLNGDAGIHVRGNGTTIQGNFIGTDASGQSNAGNGIYGVEVDGAAHTIIGGTVAGARNILSANGVDGVAIESATDVVVAGNYIGVDSTGTNGLGNVSDGVSVTDTLADSGIIIDHNVIAGSVGDGILLVGAGGVTITGNLIGTDSTGLNSGGLLSNSGDNIRLESDLFGSGSNGNLIGGNTATARNVIGGGDGNGVGIYDSSDNIVSGNYIGIGSDGVSKIGVGQNGVHVEGDSSGNLIGGTGAGEGNVISANAGDGVRLLAPAVVQGNLIGTGADGVLDRGNVQDGIYIDSDGSVIGGSNSGEGNLVAFNHDTGIIVLSGIHNAIRGNSLHDNVKFGIDLVEIDQDTFEATYGVTLNDSAGHDGPNLFQNFPVLGIVTRSGPTLHIPVSLSASPGTYSVDIFASADASHGGYGEGATYLGSVDVIVDGSGTGSATASVTDLNPFDLVITATATDVDGNTSEFSRAVGIQASAALPTQTTLTGSGSPSNYGEPVTLTATASSFLSTPISAGSIQFYEAGVEIGMPVPVNATGQATLLLSPSLSLGSHTFTARYLGDGGTLSASESDPITQEVVADATATALAVSPTPSSTFGQTVTLTATVTGGNAATGTPAGTVEFFDGTTSLGTRTLNSSGIATLVVSNFSVGDHVLSANYSGNGSTLLPSTSANVNQHVVAASTATALVSSLNPAVYGQTITYTATVQAVSPGAGTPTGSIVFKDGSTVIDTVPLSGGMASLDVFNIEVGDHNISAEYVGNASFTGSNASLVETVTKASTTTTLDSSLNPASYGQSVTFTATVHPGTPGALTGTVTFYDGSTPLGTVPLAFDRTASFTIPAIAAGSHTITAQYSGDTTFLGSTSDPLTEDVARAGTTTTLSTSPGSSVLGQGVTLQATVASPAGTPTGTVTFFEGVTPLGTTNLSGGVATLSISGLAVASHSFTAMYSGSISFADSTGSTTHVVNAASTATTVVSSVSPSVFGQAVTFTASVSILAPGAGSLTGNVTFFDGASPIGTSALSGGQATLSVSNLGVGHHVITARYLGDGNFNASTSAVLDQAVNAAPTTTALSSSISPSSFGQSVTFTASVSSNFPGSGMPDGSVVFTDGSTTLATVTLVGGVATFTSSTLSTGGHSITATYSGSSSFNGSTATLSQVVSKLATTTTVSSSINPSVFGQSVILTASVTGGTSTSGTVTFFDGATSLGTATLSSGGATLTLSSFGVGHHSITAQYSGDTNFTASTSAALDQVVNAAATTTAVTSSTNPSSYGDAVTFTATVAVTSPGAGSPTGTVTFKDGATVLGTGALSGGIATFTTTATLAAGTHSITAVYSGDSNFTASTGALTQTVNARTTSTTVTSSTNPSVFGQSVTLTATVSGANAGSGPITGTVTFLDGSTAIGTGTISSGVATLTVSNFTVAHHTITARYEGTTSFAQSTSAALDQNVIAASTTTTLTSSTNPSPFTTGVTFTATVAAIAPGAGTAGGTITFKDGAMTLATITLSGGTATFTTSTLTTGAHSITATYSGSTSFYTSTASLTQNVTALPTTTTLTGSPNPSTPGQSVTFTATVAGGNSTTGVPTGTVTFFDGSTALGTVPLASGVASLSTTSLSTGSHTITAVYNAATNFTTSTSNPVTQTVSTPANGSVIGFVYNDANNNGTFEGGELPISGVTLTLTGTNDLSQTVTLTASSDSTGAYRFDNLRPGTYKVTETQPAGYGDGLDAKNNVVIAGSNGTDAISNITLASGQTAANNNFGELQLTISGTVLNDVTGNGLSNEDTPLSGVLVNLYADTNHSGTLDSGDAIIDHVTTGSSGTYSFTKVPGRYFIQEVTPSGYLRTAPTVSTFYNINAPIGGTSTGNDFDNFLADCDLSDVSGISYLINGTTSVSQLRGNIHQGDTVEAIFTIAAGEPQHRYSLVSYTAPSAVFDASVASQQMVYDTDSQVFGPGVHTLTVTVPDCFFQIDFVCGSIIDRLGPANSNIFYTPQGRLIDADNNGTQACINNAGSISGFTYVDINNNGLIDLNDGIIPGVKVTLTGTNDQGASVSMTEFSDDDGQYFFGGLRPGTYTVTETQPTGVVDGKETLGTIAGASASNFGTVGSDKFTNIKIGYNQDGVNYNFGENDCGVQCGQAATIGFWQNSNGQALIKSLNGGSSATNLGIWLANTYPNLYGSAAGVANLLGKTNAQIASFYTTLFKTTGQKLDAQVMSVALAIYVTDSGHAGTAGTNYGFTVNDTGLAVATFSVGSNGAAFGYANNTTLTVGSLMDIANDKSWAGVLWDVDHTGVINSTEQAWRNMANTIFSAINTTGDIS